MKITFYILLLLLSIPMANAQEVLTLERVTEQLALHSPPAHQAALTHENALLTYQNYRKGFLPALSFSLDPLSFNRSIKSLQNPTDGSYSYIEDYANSSSTGVSIRQAVGATGGSFNISSRLNMLSEFQSDRYSFSTTIFNISYNQQLFGGYRNYRFQQTTQLAQYERSVKAYCKEIADIQSQAVSLFLDLYLLTIKQKAATHNIRMADTLLAIGQSKYENGALTEQNLLQLKLQQTNDRFEAERLKKEYRAAMQRFISYLDLNEEHYAVSLNDTHIPESIVYDRFIQQVIENSPFFLALKIKRTQAEQTLYGAKLNNRFNGSINLSYGVNQYADQFAEAYKRPASQQAVSVGFQIPMFNWGINRNQLRMAKNNYENTLIDIDKEETDFYDNLKTQIGDYNSNRELLAISRQSLQLAQRQYNLLTDNFYLGEISILEITQAHKELLGSLQTYCDKIRQVWTDYFRIRSLALYDFQRSQPLLEIFVKR